MPVEIRELTIKVQVAEQAPGNSSAGSGEKGSGDNSDAIKEAVEEVLRIMESKKER